MKKKVGYLVLAFMAFITFKVNVLASGTLSIWSNVVNAKVGDNVTISVKVDNIAGNFSVTSSDSSILSGGTGGQWLENNTYSFTFVAKGTGTATITVKAIDAADFDANPFTGSKSVSVSVINVTNNSTPNPGSSGGNSSGNNGSTDNKKNYSSNNNLSLLEVEGYSLNPSFDKDKLEYSLELPSGTSKINVKATAVDSKATIRGIGEINVQEGINKIEIKVIAENGNEKIYVINANVKELDPIEVKIGNDIYTVMRGCKDIEAPYGYLKEKIKINDEEIDAYYNEKMNNYLVVLKDKEGNTNFYNYKDNKYSLYQEFKVGNVVLNLIDDKEAIPSDYQKTTIDYQDSKINVYYKKQKANTTYATDNKSPFYLVYGINVATGKKSLYVFDSEENTLQRYNGEDVEYYKQKSDTYLTYLIITLSSVVVFIVVLSIILIVKSKSRSKHKFVGI